LGRILCPRREREMDAILRRLRSLNIEHRTLAQHRTMSMFGAWKALDDDPVLLCECGDADCPHRR
jgi:hypothetical protein